MIDIYRDNEAILSVSNKNATHKDVVMGDNNVKIDLVVSKELDVKDGDYIVFKGIKYTQNRDVEFVKRSAICFEYYCEFEHPLYRLLDKLFIFNLTNSPVFTLTGKLADFVNLVIWNMNLSEDNPQGIDEGWVAGSIIDTDYLSISFDSINCKDALSMIAGVDYFNAEYYFSENGKKINFTAHIENETGLVFEQGAGKGLYSIRQENVDTKDTVTRVYPVGGTQNVPNALADGNGNLKLPELFLQDTSEYSRIVEKRVVFDSIFPHFLGTIGSVEGDNNEMIFCPQIDFDLNEIAVGDNARINFITGDLMGISFQFSYDHALQRVTLIEQEDTVALAGDDGTVPMIPSLLKRANVDDKFNFTGVIMPDSYNTNAITGLREKGSSFLAFYKRKRVKFVLDIDNRWMRNKTALKAGDLVRIKIAERGIDTPIRITDISTSLYDGKVSATVSNYLDENWEKQVEGKLSSIKTTVISGNYGGSEVDILQQSDARPVSDRNVMSGLRSRKEFLRKDATDTASERISFDKGFDAYNFEQGQLLGSGLGVFEDALGNSVLEVDKLSVRKEAWFNEIVINQIRFQGGIVVYSAAALEVLAVQFFSTYIQVKFDTKNGQIANQFVVDDQVRCQRFVGGSVTKYYMSRVTSVGADYINLSRQDYDGTLNPEVGDVIVQFGNRTDVNRQALIEINALYGGKQTFYNGVNSYSLTDKNIIDIGRVLVDNQLQNLIRVYGNAYVGARDLSSYFKFDSVTQQAEFKGKITFQSGKTDTELESEIAGFGSDGIITPAEKRELKIQWDEIAYEFQPLYEQGDALGCASLYIYDDAYSYLYNYLFVNPNLLNPANMGIDSTIVPSAYKTVWSDFLKSRATLRTEIAAAINALVDVAISDGVLTPAEKLQLKSMWDGMVADHGKVVRRATAAGITALTAYTTFVSKYNTLTTYLNAIFTSMTTNSTIAPATFKTNFSDYSTAKADVEKYLDEYDEQTIASMIANIDNLYSEIAGFGSDGIITPAEKRELKIQWDEIAYEFQDLYDQGDRLGCASFDVYEDAYSALYSYLFVNPNLLNPANMGIDSTIVPSAYKLVWANFFKLRAALRTEIAAAINALVDIVASDGVLTPAEKLQLKSMWDGMVADHGKVVRRATAAGITALTAYTTFVSKYNTLTTYLNAIFTSMTTNSTIVPATFKTNFSDYATAKAEVEKYLDEYDEQTTASMIDNIDKAISDSWITPAEKRGLKIQWDTITSEVTRIYDLAESLGCPSFDVYYERFYNLSTYLNSISLFTNMAESTYISNVTTFRAYWVAYYQDKEIILSEINDKLGIKASAADYLRTAMQGSTDITGGLLLTNLLLMKSTAGAILGGMSGILADLVGMWTGGTYEQAQNGTANVILYKNGTAKVGIFKVFSDRVEVDLPYGKLKFDGTGLYLLDANSNKKVEIYSGSIPTLASIVGDGSQLSVPAQSLNATFVNETVLTNFGGQFSLAKASNKITMNVNATIKFTLAGSNVELYWRIRNTGTNEIIMWGSPIIYTTGELGTTKNISLYTSIYDKPAGTYQLELRIYTGGGTSFTYNKLDVTSGYVNYQVINPRTIIGANGMASIYSNSEYFHVEKNVGDKMRIRLSGDVQINGTNY